MNEYENEPVRGLPEHLPAGEEIVWADVAAVSSPVSGPAFLLLSSMRSVPVQSGLIV